MVKGINKQIIEILCRNNEHFEKILLIAKPSSALLTNTELSKKASELLCDFLIFDCENPPTQRNRFNFAKNEFSLLYAFIIILCIAVLVLSLVIII